MPLFQEEPNKNANTEKVAENQSQPTSNNQKSGLMTIIGQLFPLAPFAFEQFTGQKVPHMTGTMADIQMALINIQTNLQTISNNQQQLNQRLIALENNAVQHLSSLSQQFQSLRLTHTQEKKQIEFNRPQLEQNQEDY